MSYRYWISSGSSNWANTGNWSTTSGGAGGASIPTPETIAIFDSSRNGPCQLDAPVYVKGLNISGYSGTLSQNNFEMRIDDSGANFLSCSFMGDGSNIRIVGDLFVGGSCQFTSTDGTLSCDGTFTYNDASANFLHNGGTVSLDKIGATLDTSNMYMRALQFNTYGYVNKDCYTEDIVLKSGVVGHGSDATVHVRGDLYAMSQYNQWIPHNNILLLFDGTVQQTIHNESGCIIPRITIDKTFVGGHCDNTSASVICTGDSPVVIMGDFILEDGTFCNSGLEMQVGF